MKFNYKFAIITFALLTSCTFKTNITGYIKISPHYKLSSIHYTNDKPAVLNLDTIKEWSSIETDYFDYTRTKIHSLEDPFLLNLTIETNNYKKSIECKYHLIVDRVGQSGKGTIVIEKNEYPFYLVDKWALLIDVKSSFDPYFSYDATLEFIMWGS